MVLNALGTPSLPDGSTYRGSSLTSLHLQAKGSEYSFATRRRVPERKSPDKRRDVGVRNSSSGPCVLSLSIEPNCELFTRHFRDAAKVIHRRRQGALGGAPPPPVNNFGRTISAWSLLPLSSLQPPTKAPASWTHSTRFARFGCGCAVHKLRGRASGAVRGRSKLRGQVEVAGDHPGNRNIFVQLLPAQRITIDLN